MVKKSIEVITVMKDGSRIKFKITPEDFKSSLIRDNKLRLFDWVDSDKHDKYLPYYDISSIKFNRVTGSLETVELTPTTMRKTK